MIIVGSLVVADDGSMASGDGGLDGCEGYAISLSSDWTNSKVLSEADSTLLSGLKVLSLSSSMPTVTSP